MSRIAVLSLALVAAAFVALIVLEPAAEAAGIPGAILVRHGCAQLCHQIPSRSFVWAGHALPLCARCLGLYAGGALGLLLAASWVRFRAVRPWVLALVAIPSLLDVLVSFAGGRGLDNLPRFLLALPFGAVAGMLLAEAVADLARMVRPPASRWALEKVDG